MPAATRTSSRFRGMYWVNLAWLTSKTPTFSAPGKAKTRKRPPPPAATPATVSGRLSVVVSLTGAGVIGTGSGAGGRRQLAGGAGGCSSTAGLTGGFTGGNGGPAGGPAGG